MSSRRLRALVIRSAALLALAASSLSACSDGGSIGQGLPASAVGAHDLKTYRLGIGDKLKITVFGEGDLSGTFEVNPQGRVSLPLAGDIQAAGLDVATFKEAATRRFADGYLKSPRLSVEVVGYRPIYVHGEVRNGGEFAFKSGLRFRDAIALAGGYTYRANHGYVILSRPGAARDARIPLPTDLLVMPGDNIRVPERFF